MKNRLFPAVYLLLLTLTVLITSCSKNSGDGTDTAAAQTIEISKFVVVRSDTASDGETSSAQKIRSAINDTLGTAVTLTTDWDDKTDNSARNEILVGTTNREQTKSALSNLTENDFAITFDGVKIAIVGGGDYALDCAVDYFIKTYVGSAGVSLATDMNLKLSVTDAGYADPNAQKLAVFMDGDGPAYASSVIDALKGAGYLVTVYNYDTSPSEVFNADKADLAVICGASEVPTGTLSAVDSYLNNGGKLLALGGPVFGSILYKNGDKWMTQAEYIADYSTKVEGKSALVDFTEKNTIRKLNRSTNDSDSKMEKELGDFGHGNNYTLKYYVENLTSWDLFNSSCKVPSDNDAVAFWAKGDSATQGLYLEFSEKDGSRWYATVTLSSDWQYYVIPESKFIIWDSPKRAGTSFDLSNAVSCGAGFAMSGQVIASGAHTFYLDDFATIHNTLSVLAADSDVVIDGISPSYELYPITNGAKVSAFANQIYVSDTDYVLPASLFSCSPGRQATGYDTGRVSRFIPLLEVTDSKGLHSGYLAWFYRFTSTTAINGAREGSAAGVISTDDPAFYNKAGLAVVSDAVKAMLSDTYIVEGGTDEFLYIKSDSPTIDYGIKAAVSADSEADTELRVTLYSGDTEVAKLSTPAADAKENNTFRKTGYYNTDAKLAASSSDVDRAVAEIYVGGVCVDRVEHPVTMWSPKPESERKYIYTENNAFMRDGKILNLFGVNYMPSYGVAEPNGELFEYYVSAASYDPTVVYNDLLRIKELGMNAVSVFVYCDTISKSNNILDLINLCESLGIYVDLSIRPNAYPMNFSESEVKTLIEKCHFAEVDNIVAYDIAWEPGIGAYDKMRSAWNSSWTEWTKEQYGSVESAVKAWACGSVTKDSSGNIIVTDDMLNGSASSKYDLLVAAYRRFIDDYVSSIFAEKTEYIRDLDPNHLVSFRMSNAGSAVAAEWSGYDFQSLASSLDFMAPEGYALRASNDSCLQLTFAATYARYAAAGAPVVLKEYGKHVWTGSNFTNNTLYLAEQADYYDNVLQKAYSGYVSALYCWFYAGGYRIGENSDYGILNPDGSDRPVTTLLREYAQKFLAQGEIGKADEVITVDRSEYPAGITGMFDAVKSQLDSAVKAGKRIAFVDVNGSDTVYADDVDDIEVGGGTIADGDNAPLEFVNGQVMRLDLSAGGRIYSGTKLPSGGTLTVTVKNTGHSTWRAGTIHVYSEGGVTFDVAVDKDVPYLGTAKLTVNYTGSGTFAIRFSVDGRSFGCSF